MAAGEPVVLSQGSSNNDFEGVQSLAVPADGVAGQRRRGRLG